MENTDSKEILYNNLFMIIENNKNIDLVKEKYLNLLQNLTEAPGISTEMFIDFLNKIQKSNSLVLVAYLQIDDSIEIVGTGTILIEQKLIRGGKSVGHIEDIVVNPNYRGKHIAQNIIKMLKSYAIEKNCYKIILDCDEKLKGFYEKNDFIFKGIQMAIYL